MATYEKIQKYVKENYGFLPKTCWIAHMKELNGLPTRKAPNRIAGNKRTNPCPVNKQEYIQNAFRHFKMINQ